MNSDKTENTGENKKTLGYRIHLFVGVAIALVIVIAVVRLIIWNGRNSVVEHNGEDGEFATEILDYYSYSDSSAEKRAGRNTIKALVIGNYMVNNFRKDHSVINELRKSLPDWEFTDLSADLSSVTSESNENEGMRDLDCFSLFYVSQAFCKTAKNIAFYKSAFTDNTKAEEAFSQINTIDLNDYDILIIMYSFLDYYRVRPVWYSEPFITTFNGAFDRSLEMLTEKFPNLEIIVSSGFPMYIYDSEGNIELGYSKNYGGGTLSEYMSMETTLTTKYGLSFIDNYYYKINEENITTYLDQQQLTDEGIDLVAGHMTEYLKKYIK